MGWESLFRCAYYSSVWQCLWPCKIPARKNSTQVLPGVIGKKKFKYFPRRDTQARSYSKFQNQGPVLSSQNVQIPCQNVQIHRHDRENVILIRRRGVPGEIPRNSRETLPCPDLSRQMVSREKKCHFVPTSLPSQFLVPNAVESYSLQTQLVREERSSSQISEDSSR